ncbi:hypothetical protein [Aerosakkonema funiforme]|uniref:hypothetical protein n=1 Tax=Aerosakkonema funiforme TaxID=1246630 RepID=UPI0035BB2472
MSELRKCKACGYLRLSETPMSEKDLQGVCTRTGRFLPSTSMACQLELVATGPTQDLADWACSLMLGLDNPLKGP